MEALLHMLSTMDSELKWNRDFAVYVIEKSATPQTVRARSSFPEFLGTGEKIIEWQTECL